MENYDQLLIKEEDELNSNEYLGTFRWKKTLKFPKLELNQSLDYSSISNWTSYLNERINFEIEPFIVDALSYPLSIIFAIESLRKSNENIGKFIKDKNLNIVIIGASKKTEVRIALETNYFDEIYNYLFYIKSSASADFKLNVYFVGEEVETAMPNSKTHIIKKSENLSYIFYKGNTGNFLKDYALEFNKFNTIYVGMNCGFGAGFINLTVSWVKDLQKLLKFGYISIFTYTNNYEDMVGEYNVMQNLLGSYIILKNEDNPYKSMTTYCNDQGLWSCGNYGFYVIHGYDKDKMNKITKLNDNELKVEILKVFPIKI